MRRSCSWSAASLLALALAGSAPARAATVLERSIDVEIRPDGSVLERTLLKVRMESPGDVSRWATHLIPLDLNRELVDLSGSFVGPDGRKVKLSRRDLDDHQVAASSELHSSRAFRSVSFPGLVAGSVLTLEYEVKERPYFPAGYIPLGDVDATAALRIDVRGGGAGWRWRIDGGLPGVQAQGTPGGVTVTAAGLPALSPPDKAPAEAASGAVLRYAWGTQGGWEGVGRWYEEVLAPVGRGAEPVRGKARELTAGLGSKREKIGALVDFARRRVRYVAVEVGIGGYRPAAPRQVMERLWGDCKDKAVLLVDLLREVGIEAYPALIRLDPTGRVDREFPSPSQFNHLIVAVPAEGLGLAPGSPVSGGYLFLDATQRTGGVDWLQPAVQDQEALIVRDGRGVLVRTPILAQREGLRLEVDLDLAVGGEASGSARLDLSGGPGAAFLELQSAAKPQEVDLALRHLFATLLPAGVSLEDIRWRSVEGGVPNVILEARVRIPSLGAPAGEGALPPLPLPADRGELPSPGLLEGRALPVVADPFESRVVWKLNLPRESCKAESPDVDVHNDLGSFRQTVTVQGRTLILERGTSLRQRWIDPAGFPALKEIALAESRAGKRRLRVTCG